ncbi:MAG: DUF438 domain-containing protein [Armatimonadota bacterium]|nr:DUF438 domain-containing protein [Armatimonadota bacterium]MDW8025404.1 DUF438 domain-containing protein [Armatimonadota bacterium]
MAQLTYKEAIKQLLRRLHAGEPIEQLKGEFAQVLSQLHPEHIALIEQELIEEGISPDEIKRLCDLHIEVFREVVERARLDVPQWHPIYILVEEHRAMLGLAKRLDEAAGQLLAGQERDIMTAQIETIKNVAHHFVEYERHMEREENAIFPFLERHGVTQPPAIMWTEHNEFREMRKHLLSLIESGYGDDLTAFIEPLRGLSSKLLSHLTSHYYKENNVLFPMALRLLSQDEWKAIRSDFDEIGYCCFTPQVEAPVEVVSEARLETAAVVGAAQFETGTLTHEQLEAMLNALPFDITFIDADDVVRYFNSPREGRMFVRTKAVLGRKVQQCHPQSSLHVVNRLLDEMKSGKRDVAEFWINLRGRLVHIRYFAVRDAKGRYLGCMEVTQDITDIKLLEGEKRLLD